MIKVLITGAAGFIGMHVALKFIKEGYDVIGLDNLNDYYSVELKKGRLEEIERKSDNFSGKWSFIKADIVHNITWSNLKKQNINKVVHLAAQAGVRYSIENPNAYLETNITGFQKVLNFCVESKINHLIYASSSSVYGKDSIKPFKEYQSCNNPESYYAATKKCNELMAAVYYKTNNLSSIGLRFFTVYGPWGRPDMAPMLFAKAAIKNETIKVYNFGKQSRDFTYIDDIVEGVFLSSIKLWNESKQVIDLMNIGYGSPVNLMDFINLLENNLGIEIKRELVEAQKGDVEETFASVEKLYNFIGYKPKVPLNIGINKFVEWYKTFFKI